jgi:hypothetical protein
MPIQFPIILAGFLAIAAPGQNRVDLAADDALGNQMQSDETPNGMLGEQDEGAPGGDGQKVQLTDTELFSAVAGNIVGAATLCRQINKDRVTSATDQVAALVSATSADKEEQSLSKLLFMHNVGGGRQAVQTGEVECSAVDDSLTKLEQFAQRATNATNSGGSQ